MYKVPIYWYVHDTCFMGMSHTYNDSVTVLYMLYIKKRMWFEIHVYHKFDSQVKWIFTCELRDYLSRDELFMFDRIMQLFFNDNFYLDMTDFTIKYFFTNTFRLCFSKSELGYIFASYKYIT